jgi:hypothetical protein
MSLSHADWERMHRNMLHAAQVQNGLIPADSPPDFTLPQPLDSKGLPWWFGPDYDPTPEAIGAFSEPPDQPPAGSDVDEIMAELKGLVAQTLAEVEDTERKQQQPFDLGD